MSKSEMQAGGQAPAAAKFVFSGWARQAPERLLATGLGSRGGPNKPSNKLRTRPSAYLLFN